ncbi:vascular endothelial growth factor receptor 1-like [Diprion similis]|uniref:vascular endothelial growth factor receptor 1-like n=1 Tax=Diprion similis TaxID=362088 RepID=UPI001EF8C9A1|nr:vascular endothelial growth factor receptor 1-like [Diprion similis]
MDWIILTCVIAFIVSGQPEGVAARKPRIKSNAKNGIIQEGNELRISCKGDSKLHFSTMDVPHQSDPCINDLNFGWDTVSFVCHNATRRDTGWYACAEEGIKIRNTDQTLQHAHHDIAWIHIYVNSTEPFAETVPYRDVKVKGKPVIPCRTTSPHWKVALRLLNEDVPGQFDPEIGFIVADGVESLDEQLVECHAINNENNTLDGVGPVEYGITEIKDDVAKPKPKIKETALHHMVWGRDQNITCTVTVTLPQTLGTHPLDWKLPESVQVSEVLNSAVTVINPMDVCKISAENLFITCTSNLTIKSVRESDSGDYTCFLPEHRGDLDTEDTRHIKFWNPDYSFIDISIYDSDGSHSIVGKVGETSKWNIKIDTYPEYSELHWYKKKDDRDIEIELTKLSRFQVKRSNLNHLFEIHNSEVKDNGDYVILVRTKNEEKKMNLHLRIDASPQPCITPSMAYVAPGQSKNFLCTTVSHPLANVTWSYMEWPHYPLLNGSRPVFFPESGDSRSIDLVTSVSRFNIKINDTGNLTCKSCNDIGCVEDTKLIYVSEVNASFGIIPLESVVEGDDINITCGISVYHNFSDGKILGWNISDLELETGRIRILSNKTKFTHQSILEIRGVNLSDEGTYVCDVFDKSKDFKSEAYNLSVTARIGARIDEWNINTKKLVIDTDKKQKDGIVLRCIAVGMPKPETVWLKDGKVIAGSQGYKISEDKSQFHIKSFFEQDSGVYTCRVENRLNRDERSVKIEVKGQSYVIWISLICVLVIISVIIIIYMGIQVKHDRRLKKELLEAGLTTFVEGAVECLNPDLNIDDQAELLPYDKKWEFPRERLKLGKQLGSGAFGVVMKAEAQGIRVEEEVTTVAVKMVRRSAEPSYMKALSSELKIMTHLGQHLNVVNLLGACTKNILTKRELYVIVEYCRFGNLHNYLQRHRDSFINQIDPSTKKIDIKIGIELLARCDSVGEQRRYARTLSAFSRSVSIRSTETNNGAELMDHYQNTDFVDINMSPDGLVLSNNSVQPGWRSNYRGDYRDYNLKPTCTQDLLCWAWQVARGMEYLSSRRVLHGDLAARNILLADDRLVKICDFGLAKNMYKDDNYQKKENSPLPIKWMAIESIRDKIFSTQSDIWSFGIVLWEFFTLAHTPYPGMDAEKQYHRLVEGYRMEKPEYATSEIYDFMLECWNAKPSLRPTFPELVGKLGDLLNESVRMHYCEQDDTYTEMNNRNLEDGQNDYLTMMFAPNTNDQDLCDGTMEPSPNSNYLPMSPIKSIGDSDIFSPRTKDSEYHFDFPSTSNETAIDSIRSGEKSREEKTREDPQEKEAELNKKDLKFSTIATDKNYSNVINNRPASNPPNQLQDELKASNRNFKDENIGNNYINFPANLTKPDHYINMPQQKNNQPKNPLDSFSNPSYVTIPQS